MYTQEPTAGEIAHHVTVNIGFEMLEKATKAFFEGHFSKR